MDAKDDLKRTTLRLSQDLYDRVEDAAERNNRSFNAEVTDALEERYPPSDKDFARRVKAAMDAAGVKDVNDPRFFEVIAPLVMKAPPKRTD